MTLSKAEQARRAEARTKKLDAGRVERHNKGREAAEQGGQRGPGRPGAKTQDRPKDFNEARERVKAEEAERRASSGTKAAAPAEREFRDPTRFEVDSVKFAMEMGNQPLRQLERDLEQFGLVSESGEPPALAKKGEIPASERELEFGAQCTAATLVNFAPSVAYYLAPISLAMFAVGFVGSRLVIFLRIKRSMDAEAKAQAEREERAKAARSQLNPTAVNNGQHAAMTVHQGGTPATS